MLTKVISGGQTGADIGGLRAARKAGIPTGGWAPKRYLTERGPMPYLLGQFYGLKEHASETYPPRTIANIHDSQMTLIVADCMDKGSGFTRDMCFKLHKPVFHIQPNDFEENWLESMSEIYKWVKTKPHSIINVAGNRESRHPGIAALTTSHLFELFKSLR